MRRQGHRIPFEPQTIWVVGNVRRQLLARQLAEIGALPIGSDQEGMRGRKRRQPGLKPLEKIGQRLAVADRQHAS
jgi:hypothetical protein